MGHEEASHCAHPITRQHGIRQSVMSAISMTPRPMNIDRKHAHRAVQRNDFAARIDPMATPTAVTAVSLSGLET